MGSGPPLVNRKNIGLPSNAGPASLKNNKIQFRAIIGKRNAIQCDDGPLIGSFHPSKNRKKNVVKVGPLLAKLSGSEHDLHKGITLSSVFNVALKAENV